MSYAFFASCYDALTKNVEYPRRAEYICSLLSENGIDGGLLLDLACGTGSLSVEFAKRGYNVIGVDLSEEMLSVAQNKNFENGTDVMFLCQDMRNLDLYGTVDCAVCALDSLNHLLSEDDLSKTFEKVSLFLNDGGVFTFDLNTVYKHREVLGDNAFVYENKDVFCVWRNALLEDNLTVEISLDFFARRSDGNYERFSEGFSEKAFDNESVIKLLEKADFTLLGQYNELTKDAPDSKTQRIVYVARRNNR